MITEQNTSYSRFLFKSLFIFVLILFAVNLFVRLYIIPFYNIEIGGIEINIIDGVIKILSGQKLYTDPANPPYDIIQYSPVYYYLVAGLSKVFGISAGDPYAIFIVTRCMALVSNLLTMVVVYFLSRRFKLSQVNSILAGIFSFVILTQHYYSRGDSLYCLLFMTATYFFIGYIENNRKTDLVAFAFVSFCCIFTKQSGIIIPVTAGIYMLIKKDFKPIVTLIATYIIFSLIFLAISGSIGGLEVFYRNVVLGVKNGTSLDMIRSFYDDKYYRHSIVWVVLGFILSAGIFRKSKDNSDFYIRLLLFSSLIFAFITGFKIGSSLNYFIECFILTFIVALVFIRTEEKKIYRIGFYAIFFLSILIKTGELYSATFISKFRNSNIENYRVEKIVSDYMINEMKLNDSDYVFLDFRGYTELFLHGKSILNQKDFNYMVYIYAFPEINFIPMLQKADNGLIKYIITKDSIDNVNIFGRPFKNFEIVKTIGDISIYKYSNPDIVDLRIRQ
jgi:hypothetical protein